MNDDSNFFARFLRIRLNTVSTTTPSIYETTIFDYDL
jgi:hypothetical protein